MRFRLRGYSVLCVHLPVCAVQPVELLVALVVAAGLLALAVDDRGDVLVDAAIVLKLNALLPPIA